MYEDTILQARNVFELYILKTMQDCTYQNKVRTWEHQSQNFRAPRRRLENRFKIEGLSGVLLK